MAYDHPGCHRTSNAVDRPMNRLCRLMYAGRGLHGHQGSSELRLRGWALLMNFRPYAPRSKRPRAYDSPAHRLNGKRYHEHWLHNLMASTSLMGFRNPKPRGHRMDTPTQDELTKKRCRPCEGGIPALTREQSEAIVRNIEGWTLDPDARRITRSWTVKDFLAAIDFFNKIAAVAEEEDHHPDLHLEGYRNVTIALSTHAVKGLTENDFILAAKINQIPVAVRTK